MAVQRMVEAAYAERTRVLPPLTPAQKNLGPSPNLTTLDPHTKAFKRKGSRQAPPQGSNPLLVEAGPSQQWNRYGRGTWMGVGESLKVKTLPGESHASIFVGSFDGVITRFKRTVVGALEPLEEVAKSKMPGGQEYSLGYGVYGLEVGDLDGDPGTLEVVASVYGRIAVFAASDLTLLATWELPEWQMNQPMRLAIGEIYPPSNRAEIICRTLHGRILVLQWVSGGQLTLIGQHEDGGVQDIVVGPLVGRRVSSSTFTVVQVGRADD